MRSLVFDGHIAGIGTGSGVRLIVGRWAASPFGPIADVMVETADGHRVLIAPTAEVADFIATTYHFDEVRIEPTVATAAAGQWTVRSRSLTITAHTGRRTAIGWLLTLVPGRLTRARWWCRLIDLPARLLRPGVRTVGTAGGGRREYYRALDEHTLTAVDAVWEGRPLGALGPVRPPVRFGFGSTPQRASVVRVSTLIDLP